MCRGMHTYCFINIYARADTEKRGAGDEGVLPKCFRLLYLLGGCELMRQRGGVGLGDDLFCSAVPFSKALLLDTAVVKLKLSNDVTRQLHPARADVPAHAMCSIVLSCLLSVTDGAEGTASTSEVLTVPSTLASAGTWAHRANLGGKGEWFESVAMVISFDRRVLVIFVQSIFMCWKNCFTVTSTQTLFSIRVHT